MVECEIRLDFFRETSSSLPSPMSVFCAFNTMCLVHATLNLLQLPVTCLLVSVGYSFTGRQAKPVLDIIISLVPVNFQQSM